MGGWVRHKCLASPADADGDAVSQRVGRRNDRPAKRAIVHGSDRGVELVVLDSLGPGANWLIAMSSCRSMMPRSGGHPWASEGRSW